MLSELRAQDLPFSLTENYNGYAQSPASEGRDPLAAARPYPELLDRYFAAHRCLFRLVSPDFGPP
jgi:hypothetical protein